MSWSDYCCCYCYHYLPSPALLAATDWNSQLCHQDPPSHWCGRTCYSIIIILFLFFILSLFYYFILLLLLLFWHYCFLIIIIIIIKTLLLSKVRITLTFSFKHYLSRLSNKWGQTTKLKFLFINFIMIKPIARPIVATVQTKRFFWK